MSVRFMLRAVAVVIAVLGMIDPVVTLERPLRASLVIAVDETVPAALSSAIRVSDLLRDAYDVKLRHVAAVERESGCATGERCVLIGSNRWAASTLGEIVGVLRVETPTEPRVAIARVAMPAATSASAVGQLTIELQGASVSGQSSTIDVLDRGVLVGRADHAWTGDGRVAVPVQWWPLGGGLRRLSIRVTRGSGTEALEDASVDVGVEVGTEPYNVLVYDTRPSWTSTFIRRALEQDARIALRVAARLGPRLQVTAGAPFRLDETTLGDASAVVIGAPDGLSAQEVDALERFVRVRGGSLVLAPDTRPTGPIARLLSARLTERLEPSPLRVGDWRAAELLVSHDVRAGASILAKAGADAVVVATPSGNGRIIVFGAMDAWRYRDDDDAAFDRAWQSLVADAAAAGGRPIDLLVDRAVVRPAEEVKVEVRLRAMTPLEGATTVSATSTCGDQPPRMLRLWPTGDRRLFEGRFSPDITGTCRVAVSSRAPIVATANAEILVSEDFHRGANFYTGSAPLLTAVDPLANIAHAAGAEIRSIGDETTVARDVRQRLRVEVAPSRVQPMRSPWWVLPFAGCLGLEWWLRRRRGLR